MVQADKNVRPTGRPMTTWLETLIRRFAELWPRNTFLAESVNVQGLLAVILVGLICGSIGSMVVGNRMAFFSDALAHCAFAGVALGILFGLVTGASAETVVDWLPAIMVGFGVLVGLGIALVRDFTHQASDTVIGVFFAGAIGAGAVVLQIGTARRYFPPEDFLFGNLVTVGVSDLLWLVLLLLACIGWLMFMYNQLVLTSVNASLARSRGVKVRVANYVFIILLAVLVNVCLKVVGVLLVNALLIVPAATAANLCRNMRQLFRWSILLCVIAGIGGQAIYWEIYAHSHVSIGESGAIVVLSVVLFFLSMFVRPMIHARPQGETS
jgi:zinc transport system permease protein